MTASMSTAMAGGAGALAGVLFFGGLWLTVRAMPKSRWPGLLMIGSFWIRTLITLAALYFTIRGDWHNAIAWIAGFILARVIVPMWLHAAEGNTRCT